MHDDHKSTIGEQHADKMLHKLVDDQGNVLGGLVKVPEGVAYMYNIAMPRVRMWLSEVGNKQVADGTKWVLGEVSSMSAKEAEKMGGVAGLATALVIPHLESIGTVEQVRKTYKDNRHEILSVVAPLIVANKAANKNDKTGYEGNLVIERAMHEASSNTYKKLTTHAADLIPAITVNVGTIAEHQSEVMGAQIASVEGAAKTKLEKDIARYNATAENVKGKGTWISGALESGAEHVGDPGSLREKLDGMAFGKIQRVGEYLQENGLNGTHLKGSTDNLEEVTRFVDKAFIQFRDDVGGDRPVLPSARLRKVSEQIAAALVGEDPKGDLNWLSLYNIIGKDELLNPNKKGFISHDEIEKVLVKEAKQLPRLATMDVQQFLSDSNYTMDDLKGHVTSKDKDERALAVFLHDDPVLLKAGMKQEEIADLRAHLNKRVTEEAVAADVIFLAKHSDEQLRERHMDSDDIYALRRFAENKDELLCAMHNPDEALTIKTIARKDLMPEQADYLGKILSGKGDSTVAGNLSKEELDGMQPFKPQDLSRQSDTRMRSVSQDELDDMPAYTAREAARRGSDTRPPTEIAPKSLVERASSGRDGDEAYLG